MYSNIDTIMMFFAVLACLAISIFIHLRVKKDSPHQWYALAIFSLGVWSISSCSAMFGLISNDNFYVYRILHLGSFFSQIGFIKWTLSIKTNRSVFDKRFTNFCVLFALFSCVASFSRYFMPSLIVNFNGIPFVTPGPLFFLLPTLCALCSIYGIFMMFQEMIISSGNKRIQLTYIIALSITMYTAGLTWFLFVYGIKMPPSVVAFFMIFSNSLMAYAIVRHNFMNIRLVIQKTIIYSALITTITIIYFILVYLIEKVFSLFVGYHSIPIAVAIIAFFSIIFNPLKNHIQHFIDKYFFHGTIDEIDEENTKLREELQKSEKLKAVATLAAGMAHEIKNPLTSIKTFTEHINKKKTDPEFLNKFQEVVGPEVDRINNIVKQLLEFSKPKDPKPEPSNISLLLNDTQSLMNSKFIQHNIKVIKNYEKFPVNIMVDPHQMKQVFLNLFLNAIEAMPNGGTLTIKTSSPAHTTYKVLIKDTGVGIDKPDLEHIFDPFYTKKDKGTGLGLSVVHSIIENHAGKIYAKSLPGKGTSFVITLPLKDL